MASSSKRAREADPMKAIQNTAAPVLGLRANAAQFTLLVAVNALVGGMLGQERTVLPLLAKDVFGLDSYTAALTYILAFGLAKAFTNYLAGTWSERYGRKPVLVAGWLVAVPVPLLLIWAPQWWIVVAANVLLGISQGLTWSTTVIMKIDLVGPSRRGLAMGLNESAGYLALAMTALLTGNIAAHAGLRPEPFLVGIAYAALGLGLSALVVRETRGHADHEATTRGQTTDQPSDLTYRQVFTRTSFPRTSTLGRQPSRPGEQPQRWPGLGPVPGAVHLRRAHPGRDRHPGGPLPRRLGSRPARHRRPVGPVGPQAPDHRGDAAAGRCPCHHRDRELHGRVGSGIRPARRRHRHGLPHPPRDHRGCRPPVLAGPRVYRLWRDLGFAVGALLTGVLADTFGIREAVWVIAGLTAASGIVVALRMYETHTSHRTEPRLD